MAVAKKSTLAKVKPPKSTEIEFFSKIDKGSAGHLENYDPFIYFGHEEPPDDSDWGKWVKGENPQFSSEFALYCWWQLMQALCDFICWDCNPRYKDYVDYDGFEESERGNLSLKNELSHALKIADEAIKSGGRFVNEYQIESKVFDLANNSPKEAIQIFSACVFIGLDLAISALLRNDAKKSSEYFLFAKGCINVVDEYLRRRYPRDFVDYKKVIEKLASDMGRKNALKRLAKDPKEAAMQKIEQEHEALKPHQKTRGYLAPFARDMQKKYSSVLDSPVAIERRIRRFKKASNHSNTH